MLEGGDTLELQPLRHVATSGDHDGHHGTEYSTTERTATAITPGSLEMILGLEEPIRSTETMTASSQRRQLQQQQHARYHSKTPYHHHDSNEAEYFYPPNEEEPFLVSSSWQDWWYPPDQPAAVQVFRLENLAIPASYLVVGIVQGMMRPVLNVYPLDLGATEAQQTTLASIATLPSALKILFGFWSDNVPIAGRRRKPYMLLGWILVSASMAALCGTCDLSLANKQNGDVALFRDTNYMGKHADAWMMDPPSASNSSIRRNSNSDIDNKKPPSMAWLMLVFFLAGCGMWMADVMADSLVAQKVRMEPAHLQGNLQSTCYTFRFFGLMVAAPISTYLYSRPQSPSTTSLDENISITTSGPAAAVWVILVTPLLLLPLVYLLAEDKDAPIPSTAHQCREIWKTLCSRSVWQPMGFLYVFNLLHLPNAAWRQYLKTVQGFTAAQLNDLLVASYIMLYFGTVTYKYCFMHRSWRRLYQVCILLNAAFSCLQLILIRGYTFGLSPFFFSLGDEVLQEFIVGIQFLPVSILMVTLCPLGSEGASYAMFTTTWNSAMMLAPALSSSFLLKIWDVRKETMQAGELDGLFRLTILTTVLQMSPILLLRWLPHGREDLHALSDPRVHGNSSSSPLGGAIFLFVVVAGLIYTFAVTFLNVVFPGWAGES